MLIFLPVISLCDLFDASGEVLFPRSDWVVISELSTCQVQRINLSVLDLDLEDIVVTLEASFLPLLLGIEVNDLSPMVLRLQRDLLDVYCNT